MSRGKTQPHVQVTQHRHRKLEIAKSPQPPVSAASEQLLVSLCSFPCFLLSCCTGARDRPGEGRSSTAGPLSSITQRRGSLHNTPLVGVSPHSLDGCRLGHVQVAWSLAHRLACMTSHDITHKSPYTLTCHHSPKLTDKGTFRSCCLWLVALLRGAPRGSPLR